MGIWGTGLYSNDYAADLRPTIRVALKLPLPIEEVVDLVLASQAEVAMNPEDQDYTVFWLVFADLIWKSGDPCDRVISKAIALIDGSDDLRMHEALGFDAQELKKRAKMLQNLKCRLMQENDGKVRKTLSKPMPVFFSEGDVLSFPVNENGSSINAYFPKDHLERTFKAATRSSCVIVETGMTFGFIPWYRPLVQMCIDREPVDEWVLKHPGTMRKSHIKTMGIEVRGRVTFSTQWLESVKSGNDWSRGDYFGSNDISMGNSLYCTKNRFSTTYSRAEWNA